MAAPKRTPTQREHDLELIAAQYLKGRRQVDIGADLGLSQMVISRDLKEIHKRWRQSSLIDVNEARHQELSRIDELEREYWGAWRRSCEAKTKTRTETGAAGSKASRETDQMLGNPAYLAGVQWCIERRCKIFGIDAPVRNELSGPGGEPIAHKVNHGIDGDTATSIFDILAAAGVFNAGVDDAKDDGIYTARADA